MTATKVETVYTMNEAIKELDRRLTRKIRRTKRKAIRKIKDILICVAVAGFYAGMFLYWLAFGYVL